MQTRTNARRRLALSWCAGLLDTRSSFDGCSVAPSDRWPLRTDQAGDHAARRRAGDEAIFSLVVWSRVWLATLARRSPDAIIIITGQPAERLDPP
jgi:hypothetical protein